MNDAAGIPQPIDVDAIKALFDKALAAIALLLTAPILAVTALAIQVAGLIWPEDRGPVLYREARISAGRPFTLFKLRTMQISALQEAQRRGVTVKYLERENRGHTRVGQHLCRWYLDELPQLINVLKGDMSFVGPRPPAPFEYERELSAGNVRKKLARAGLVGLQQIHKGRTKSFEEEIALDYAYVAYVYVARVGALGPLRRLVYDVGIILRSIRVLLEGKGL